jgi:hypothetical protein
MASGLVNCVPVCTDLSLAAGACRSDSRIIHSKHPCSGPRRWRSGQSGAMALKQIQLSFFGHSSAASLERPVLRAVRRAGVCVACESSFSFARQIRSFGIASSNRVATRFRAGQRRKPHSLPIPRCKAEAMSYIESIITARTPRARQTQIFDADNKRSECRGVRKRPAGFCGMPRLHDPRGSRRDGGQSETRPRVKLNYSATAPRS